MEKQMFQAMQLEIVKFDAADILTASGDIASNKLKENHQLQVAFSPWGIVGSGEDGAISSIDSTP